MQIKFDVFWTKSLGTLYKDNSVDTYGKEANVNLDLEEVLNIYANFKVGENSFTDSVEILDIENRLIRIPFKSDVLKEGLNEFEIVAVMKNGDVLPSQTYTYKVDKSLENPNAIEADTNYPVLIELMDLVENKLIDMDKSIQKVNTSIENMTNEISNYKEVTTNALNSDISDYKEATTNELEESFNNYSNSTASNITRVLDNKIVEIDNRVNSKIVEVDEVIEEVELSEQTRKEEHLELVNELSSYSSDINNVKDRVEVLEAKITDNEVIVDLKNKVNNHEERITTSEKTIRHQGILLNALNDLDDTINIEEEGIIISLPQSDDGKIIIDELQGNTLVNYCTNGNKELILNGDIDVEGTNVTLTEGVDNGLVDVMCEGNTLVNLFSKNTPFTKGNYPNVEASHVYYQKEIPMATNGTFHIIAPIGDKSSNSDDARLMIYKYNKTDNTAIKVKDYLSNSNSSLDLVVDLTSEEVLLFNCWNVAGDRFNKNYPTMMILEGDWTNREIPKFFEGMKSVGECEGNKIEILSQNKNLFDGLMEYGMLNVSTGLTQDTTGGIRSVNYTKVEPSNTYTVSNTFNYSNYVYEYDEEKNYIKYHKILTNPATITLDAKTHYIKIRTISTENECDLSAKFQIEKGNTMTSYVQQSINKKEISLNEPLRGLPSGVKDRFVKQGGKWYVERNCGQIILNGSENWGTRSENNGSGTLCFRDLGYDGTPFYMANGVGYCNNFNVLTDFNRDVEHLRFTDVSKIGINIQIKADRLSTQDVEGFKQWLSNNPTTVVYQLATPIYEEITDITLTTYTDITHISNNSTIPCNMKVKNSGYNAIIKPRTLYTVAFDTDKSGEVNVDLGGAKTSTTNGVATITTPSTLTNDSLKLYGKGINASKVRLLEGDKTNWIPSHFEGMQSSFEDKLQEDGTYKMEILSNNENLFDKNIFINLKDINKWSSGSYKNSNMILKLKPNTKYTMSIPELYVKGNSYWILEIKDGDVTLCSILSWAHNNSSNSSDLRVPPKNVTFTTKSGYLYVRGYMKNWNELGNMCEYLNKDFMLVEGSEEKMFINNKSDKIQFSSIEPLRSVGAVKDKFVLKDGKLMIERNCGEVILNGSEDIKIISVSIGNQSNVIEIKLNKQSLFKDWNGLGALSDNRIGLNRADINWGKQDDPNFISICPNGIWIGLPRNIDTIDRSKQWLAENPSTIIYELAEPTYEEVPFELQKIILEGYENGTLFFDTNIPPTVSVTYSANKPVVAKLNQVDNTTNVNTEDIAITQMAVDFLLMSSLGEEMINFKIKGGTNMSAYFASRIIKGALKYEDVINKYPNYKEDIDLILIAEGYSDLIVEL